MKPKQRLLASIRGEDTDRIAWSPFLAYWWESQSQELQKRGQVKFLQEIGADPLLRGFHQLFSTKSRNCEIKEEKSGNKKCITYSTPVGNMSAVYSYVEQANSWFLTEHPIKCEEDYKILTYINENMELEQNYDSFIEDYNTIGDEGLYVPIIGTYGKTSFQSLVEFWVGTEELVYSLFDYEDTVVECLNAMRVNSIVTAKISVKSPAEAFIFWEDSSTTNVSPNQFGKYISPEISQWSKIIHSADKKLIHHACGHLKGLLKLMADTGIDTIESISPPPTGNIELWEAKTMLPESIGLVGGIEPTVLLNSTLEELSIYVTDLIKKVGKHRYILANSDSCPPGVSIEKFKLITQIVKNYNFRG